jgi:hypothetical protein
MSRKHSAKEDWGGQALFAKSTIMMIVIQSNIGGAE